MNAAAIKETTGPGARLRQPSVRSEDGYATMIFVLALLVLGLAFSAVALEETLASRHQSARQMRSNRALQAADAGVAAELYRLNELDPSALNLTGGSAIVPAEDVCPITQTTGGIRFVPVASGASACPTNSSSGVANALPDAEPVGEHSYYAVQLVPGTTAVGDFVQFQPKIVSTGVDDNGNSSDPNRYISRRVEAFASLYGGLANTCIPLPAPCNGPPLDPTKTAEALHNLTINVPAALGAVGATVFNGTARAENLLTVTGSGLLGGAFTGVNISLTGGLLAAPVMDYGCSVSHSNVIYPPLPPLLVTGPTSASCSPPTVNPPAVGIAPSKPDCSASCPANGYLPGTHEIYVTDGSAVNLGPGDYVFCSFETNGPVNANPTTSTPVRIYIDNPASPRCSGFVNHVGAVAPFQAVPGNFVASQGVGNLLGALAPSRVQIVVLGDQKPNNSTGNRNGMTFVTSTASGVLNSFGGQAFFLWAPESTVTLSASVALGVGGALAGSFTGYDMNLTAAVVTQDLGLFRYPLANNIGIPLVSPPGSSSSTQTQTQYGIFRITQTLECTPRYPPPAIPTNGC